MKFQAIVNLPSKTVETLSLLDLESHFAEHEVIVRAVNFANKTDPQPSYKLCLYGTKENLRASVKHIYLIASQLVNGIETKPATYIPEGIKKQLENLSNRDLYKYCADEYMKHCVLNDQSPHPEVSDEFMNK